MEGRIESQPVYSGKLFQVMDFFFFQAEDGIRDTSVTGVQTCALPILVLMAMMVIGAWIRHFFNLRHAGRTVWAIPVTAALAIAGVAVAIRPAGGSAGGSVAGSVSFGRVHSIVEQRCVPCHSAHPTKVAVAPKGVMFDTPAQIAAQACRTSRLSARPPPSSDEPSGTARTAVRRSSAPGRTKRSRRPSPPRSLQPAGSPPPRPRSRAPPSPGWPTP